MKGEGGCAGGGAEELVTGACSWQKTVPPKGLRQAVHRGFPQVLQNEATGSSGWLAQVMVVVELISISFRRLSGVPYLFSTSY